MFDYLKGDYLICLEDSSKRQLVKGRKYRIALKRSLDTFFVVDETGERGWWGRGYFFNFSKAMREMFAEVLNDF